MQCPVCHHVRDLPLRAITDRTFVVNCPCGVVVTVQLPANVLPPPPREKAA